MPSIQRRALFIYALLLTPAFAQVQGAVTNTATKAPIPNVKVELSQAGRPRYTTSTNDRGAFQIEDIAEGVYTARFTLSGFLPYRNANGTPPFQVKSGLPIKLNAEMMPLGKLSGRVIDGHGDPVPLVTMELTR